MENIFNYLKWRGDLNFTNAPFNEVDNVILCAFSYIRIEKIIKEKEIPTIKELYPKYLTSDKKESILLKNQNTLFSLLQKSERFKNVKIAKFKKELSEEQEKQFCAMTFILNEQEIFIAFRGTDETLTAWKENFNLSYLEETPSQKRAISYIEEIVTHTKKEVRVGGHSKGGNLAMYAYVHSKEKIKERIKKVYNNDGPGLKIEEDKNILKEIEKNIITFIPKSSIIGGLFANDSEIKIIESNSIGILEHDLYTWKVIGSELVLAKNMDKKTKELCLFVNTLLKEIPEEKKRNIVNFLYELLNSLGVSDVEEALNNSQEDNM